MELIRKYRDIFRKRQSYERMKKGLHILVERKLFAFRNIIRLKTDNGFQLILIIAVTLY